MDVCSSTYVAIFVCPAENNTGILPQMNFYNFPFYIDRARLLAALLLSAAYILCIALHINILFRCVFALV